MTAPTSAFTDIRHLAGPLARNGYLLVPHPDGHAEADAGTPGSGGDAHRQTAYDLRCLTSGELRFRIGGPGVPGVPTVGYTADDLRPVRTPHGSWPPKLLSMLAGALADLDVLDARRCPTVTSLAAPVRTCADLASLGDADVAVSLRLVCPQGWLAVGPWTRDDDGLAVAWQVYLAIDEDEPPVDKRGIVSLRADQLAPELRPVAFLTRWAVMAAALAVCESSPVCPEPRWQLAEREVGPLRAFDPDAWLAELTTPDDAHHLHHPHRGPTGNPTASIDDQTEEVQP